MLPDNSQKLPRFRPGQWVACQRTAVAEVIDVGSVAADGRQFEFKLVPVGMHRAVMAAGDDHHLHTAFAHAAQGVDGLATDLQCAVEQRAVEIQGDQAVLHGCLQEYFFAEQWLAGEMSELSGGGRELRNFPGNRHSDGVPSNPEYTGKPIAVCPKCVSGTRV